MSNLRKIWLLLIYPMLALLFLSACGVVTTTEKLPHGVIPVVATENFYGDMLKQIGGDQVAVTSILSDPTVDPHEYEPTVQDAIAVSEARLVMKNGGGYDGWMDKLLEASPNAQRMVLTAFDSAPVKLPDNEHVWYSIENAQSFARLIAVSLKKLDPSHAALFDRNVQHFVASLDPIQQKIRDLQQKYAGLPVGLTETIYLYQTQPLGLRVLTPFEFQKAISEGNDPPADTMITITNQINQHAIRLLIYNEQTQTPVTTNIQDAAEQQHIPLVSVTEIMPVGKTYQEWMLDQLTGLEQALQP